MSPYWIQTPAHLAAAREHRNAPKRRTAFFSYFLPRGRGKPLPLGPRCRVRLGLAHPFLPEVPLGALRFWWLWEAGRRASGGARIFGCEPSLGFWRILAVPPLRNGTGSVPTPGNGPPLRSRMYT